MHTVRALRLIGSEEAAARWKCEEVLAVGECHGLLIAEARSAATKGGGAISRRDGRPLKKKEMLRWQEALLNWWRSAQLAGDDHASKWMVPGFFQLQPVAKLKQAKKKKKRWGL